jgi:D-threo-aldose 1-dehydrogenase
VYKRSCVGANPNALYRTLTSGGESLGDMKLIIPGLSAATTHLGYGCSQLMGGITRRESLALVQAAFASGIRHFDTAPSYGYGQAESVLGEAFQSRRDQVTIATKFGIRPPRNRNLLGIARRIVRPLIRRLPGVKSRLSRAAGGLAGRARFSPDELRASIDASLAALRTDYIDILLLHEAAVADLSDELFGELERSIEHGKIRTFGVGSEAAAVARIYPAEPRFCAILQFEWSVLSGEKPPYAGSFLITHRSLSGNLARLREWLGANPQIARAWSRELGLDVASPSALSRLMLAAALDANPGGITLFSSRSPDNIRTNAQLMLDNSDLRAGSTFDALVARDAAALLVREPPNSELESATGPWPSSTTG